MEPDVLDYHEAIEEELNDRRKPARSGTRTVTRRIRFTDAEDAELQARADRETGGNVSEYVRRAVFA